jgi:hypothetical protein
MDAPAQDLETPQQFPGQRARCDPGIFNISHPPAANANEVTVIFLVGIEACLVTKDLDA